MLDVMLPYLGERFGNPSSVHSWGQEAEAAVEGSREGIAELMGCSPTELIFTSGGSESDNLALRGAAWRGREERNANHILTTPVEHEAVLHTAEELAKVHGFELELLPVDAAGRVSVEALQERMRPDTAIVSIIYANNEIGTINPIRELGQACRASGVPFHTDAVQAASQLPIDVDELNVDLMSIGAHKFYGPKGVGCLFVREGISLDPTQTGGGQEAGRRAGTENVPNIVGMCEALRITMEQLHENNTHFRSLRDALVRGITLAIEGVRQTGSAQVRLPNHASFVIPGVDGNELVAALDLAGYACSSGSACKTGAPEPSRVLTGIGLEPSLALGSLRVSVGRPTKRDEIEGLLEILPAIVERLRSTMQVRLE